MNDLTDTQRACYDALKAHGKPVILRSMSAAAGVARRIPGFNLGAADALAREGLLNKRFDVAKNGFVYTVA